VPNVAAEAVPAKKAGVRKAARKTAAVSA